jgi:K+-transporting ATPase ATPase A chain
MNLFGWFQFVFYFFVLLLLVKPLGLFMSRIYQGERTFLTPILSPLEQLLYRISGIKPDEEMNWKTYTVALLLFNLVGLFFLYILLRFQSILPLNPQNLGSVSPHLAFNISVSFATNTNWQSYTGEATLSYLSQMLGLTVQNFLSAATGDGSLDCPHPGNFTSNSK